MCIWRIEKKVIWCNLHGRDHLGFFIEMRSYNNLEILFTVRELHVRPLHIYTVSLSFSIFILLLTNLYSRRKENIFNQVMHVNLRVEISSSFFHGGC